MPPPSGSLLPPGFTRNALCLLQKLQRRASSFELVYTPHEHWPYRPDGMYRHPTRPLRISVLDSSFNPPTLAHLALISSRPPRRSQDIADEVSAPEDYDARLLLFSTHNADKSLKPGDASFVQRLEMMYLLSRSMSSDDAATDQPSPLTPSHISDTVAVAIIDEPTFVGKSAVLLSSLREKLASLHSLSANDSAAGAMVPPTKLTFLLGFDTLERIFSPRYYTSREDMMQRLRHFLSPEGQNCDVICARRERASVSVQASSAEAEGVLDISNEFIVSERIHLIDIGEVEQTFSSTLVRAAVAAGDDYWRQMVAQPVADYIIQNELYNSNIPHSQTS
ncbi:hypothetical protein ID866_4596 [Astraeus odoratus]|nr:hypothetical protein ID866_4596 [Astraeus odoratus]